MGGFPCSDNIRYSDPSFFNITPSQFEESREGYLRSSQSLETGGWRRGTNKAAGWKRKHSILPENHEISQRKHAGHCRLHSPTNKAPPIMNQTTRTPKVWQRSQVQRSPPIHRTRSRSLSAAFLAGASADRATKA